MIGHAPLVATEHPGTILIADDDNGVRTSLQELLELAGHRVLSAGDGDKALRTLRADNVDVVILDMKMPTLDGWAVLRALDRPPPLVIVHSGQGFTPRDMREFFERRPFGILPKPVPPQHLLAAVEAAMIQARVPSR